VYADLSNNKYKLLQKFHAYLMCGILANVDRAVCSVKIAFEKAFLEGAKTAVKPSPSGTVKQREGLAKSTNKKTRNTNAAMMERLQTAKTFGISGFPSFTREQQKKKRNREAKKQG
jgi:hypothetical protein